MNEKIKEILDEYRKYESISHAQRLLNWDVETYMPQGGIEIRGEVISNLELMQQEFFYRIKERVESIDETNLDDFEKGIIRRLKREIHFYVSIPPEILKDLSKVTTESSVVWREARKKGDFSKFSPYLERIVEIERIIAEKLGYEKHPYNALLDLFEEGFTVDDADNVFGTIQNKCKPILEKIISDGRFSRKHPLERKKYDVKRMEMLNRKVLEILEMPLDRFRMDVSAHPFTTSISVNDVRITTRYEGINFKSTFYSTIHECGHAIYELQKDPELEFTPVKGAPSLGMHESQSRFFENILGRGRPFVEMMYPHIIENVRVARKYSVDDIYIYFNTVYPSLIRVDADEVTYNFHIVLRYEIEKLLLEDKIQVKDLPEIWDDFMEKYLGVRPEKVSEGVLQDIHWANGSFGYFPTYTLGNVISAMIKYKIPEFSDYLGKNNIRGIKEILREKIHRHGSIYAPKDLLKKSFGETYNPEYLIKYLEEKYLK